MSPKFCLVLVPGDSNDPIESADRLLDADVPCACADAEECLVCMGSDAISRVTAGYYSDVELVSVGPVLTSGDLKVEPDYFAVITPDSYWHDISPRAAGQAALGALLSAHRHCVGVVVELGGAGLDSVRCPRCHKLAAEAALELAAAREVCAVWAHV